jgi:hypothetical protein
MTITDCPGFHIPHCRIELTVHSRAILKVVKSMCNGIKKIKSTLIKCHTNVNSIPFTQLPHKFSYIVVILIHNHFESPNINLYPNKCIDSKRPTASVPPLTLITNSMDRLMCCRSAYKKRKVRDNSE